ncbi:MAG TPA: hypothetical protein VGX97_03895 [bacterium]|nr:hypothetical protein [bacterium]
MTPAAWLIARRALLDRPWRSMLLLFGYGAGVAIMIALLSVGDALLLEAQDRNLVAGGDVVVLPEGIDPAVIKVNGVTGLFLTIPNARFLVRDVIDGPRFRPDVIAAAPQMSSRLLYVRARGRVMTAGASAGIPSLDHAARAARTVTGATDSAADDAWLNPPVASLAARLDPFHVPPKPAAIPFVPGGPPAWVEWDYFNFFDPATRAHAYFQLLAGGPFGAVIARLQMPGAPVESAFIPGVLAPGDISTTSPDQRIGPGRLRVDAGGYHLTVAGRRLYADLTIRPDRGFMLPARELRLGGITNGHVVPVARGRADGTLRVGGRTLTLSNAPAYHDHNWGTWTGTTWDWGQASSEAGALVYDRVQLPNAEPADGSVGRGMLYLWGADRPLGPSAASLTREQGGLVAALPVTDITYTGWRPGPQVAGRRVPAPAEVTIHAASGPDSVTVRIAVRGALGGLPPGAPVDARAARGVPVFVQLGGDATLRGTIGGVPVMWEGPAASETFVRP